MSQCTLILNYYEGLKIYLHVTNITLYCITTVFGLPHTIEYNLVILTDNSVNPYRTIQLRFVSVFT